MNTRQFKRQRQSTPVARAWTSTIVAAFTAAFAVTACGSDLHLSTSELEIAPNPAVPGDMLVASFVLNLIPTQNHTIIVMIDGNEYMRVNSDDPPPLPVVIELGDAAELIAQHGTGMHSVHVEVRANESGEVTRTGSAILELEEATS